MGNVDWRPVLNLWAVVQYVTKYATKAPKGSRRLNEVLKDAVDEVCQYVPESEGSDLLRRAIQKFFARSLGERDYHTYEAVQLGLQLPMVIPMMPVVSLNTSGVSPIKPWYEMKGRANEDKPVHYDSRVAKFDKRKRLLQGQLDRGDVAVQLTDVQNLSLYEFWWKYNVYKGKVQLSTRPMCLMVTPAFSADCANIEHAIHEGYARTAVIAFWRHMSTAKRRERIKHVLLGRDMKAETSVLDGGTMFEDPSCAEDRYLGVADLYLKFDGTERGDGWSMALMEMLTDPMLKQWVPAWVNEQYERANPFFREVLTALYERAWDIDEDEDVKKEDKKVNNFLLRSTKVEMIRRHHRRLAKEALKRQRENSARRVLVTCRVARSQRERASPMWVARMTSSAKQSWLRSCWVTTKGMIRMMIVWRWIASRVRTLVVGTERVQRRDNGASGRP
jgi:hypothetical protein